MSLEHCVRLALQDGIPSVADDNIRYGVGVQSSDFPHIVYEIISKEQMTIGPKTANPRTYYKATVVVNLYDMNAQSAANIMDQVEAALEDSIGQTWNSEFDFDSVIKVESILESPNAASLGDEAEPFTARTTAELIYRHALAT